jgi:HEAT repeat protein
MHHRKLSRSILRYWLCAAAFGAALAAAPFARAQQSDAAKPKPAPVAAKPAAKSTPAKASSKTKPRKEPSGPSAQAKAAIASAQQLMDSGKPKDIEAGIQTLGLLGTKDAVEPLATRIRQGLPADLLDQAITTLMALSQPNAGPILFELAAHRRPEIRLRAVEAIAATNPPGAEQALIAGLSDSDTKVRSAAATGLGEIGTKNSLEKLFLALDRGNFEASGAIGKIVAPGDVKRLVGYLGQLPFHSLGPALAQVLQRKDVPENAKLEIVVRLEEVGTPEVKGYLGDLVSSAGEALTPTVSRALLRAMQEIAN